jgi:hypothetical protein
MSTIAQQIQAERALSGAPRVSAPGPEYVEAVNLALSHARARLQLPAALRLVWVSHPTGNRGECWQFLDAPPEILINVGLDVSPREVAWAVLHEAKHAADGLHHHMSDQEAEDGANRFAFSVTDRPPSESDFLRLDWRRPSGRR